MLSRNGSAGNSDSPQKSLQIKQDSKFFRKLLSKETSSLSSPSFRVYYGAAAAGSVPFKWESQPGTPKHCSLNAGIPPLTPPPFYQSDLKSRKRSGAKKPFSFRSSLLMDVILKRTHSPPSSSEAPSHRPQLSSSGSSEESSVGGEEEELEVEYSSKSTLCYRRWWL